MQFFDLAGALSGQDVKYFEFELTAIFQKNIDFFQKMFSFFWNSFFNQNVHLYS